MAISNAQEDLLFDDLCYTIHETRSIVHQYLQLWDISSSIDCFVHRELKYLVLIKFPSWSEMFLCICVSSEPTLKYIGYSAGPRRFIIFWCSNPLIDPTNGHIDHFSFLIDLKDPSICWLCFSWCQLFVMLPLQSSWVLYPIWFLFFLLDGVCFHHESCKENWIYWICHNLGELLLMFIYFS